MEELRECAGPIKLTLHRAFDVCRDPYEALRAAVQLGVDTILTSGQAAVCTKGMEVFKKLLLQAEDRIEIMAGSGANAKVVRQMAEKFSTLSFHMSGKQIIDSGMVYRRQGISMGLPGFSEYSILRTDIEEVKKAKQALVKVRGKKYDI